MDITFIIQVALVVVALVLIAGVGYLLKKYPTAKEILDQVIERAPEISSMVYKAVEAFAPKYSPNDQIRDIVKQAVDAVEQISKSTEMTSQEKKEKAIEYYYMVANQIGTEELASVQQDVLEVIIESVVFYLDTFDISKTQPQLPEGEE